MSVQKAKLVRGGIGNPPWDDSAIQMDVAFQLENGETVYLNAAITGGTDKQRARGHMVVRETFKALAGTDVYVELQEFNNRVSVSKVIPTSEVSEDQGAVSALENTFGETTPV